jgi:hypothetical protein
MNPTQDMIFALVEGLRARGVSVFKGPFGGLGSVEIVIDLAHVPPTEAQPLSTPLLREEPDIAKVGSDGLTAAEQLEMYGAVFDAPKD